MHRRTFLAATGATALPVSGCVGSSAGRSTLSVDLSAKRYIAGAARPEVLNQRDVEPGDVRALDDFTATLREPIRSAVRDGSERVEDSREIRSAVDELREPRHYYRLDRPYVRLDGTAYTLAFGVPTLLVEAVDVDESSVDDEAAVYEGNTELEGAAATVASRLWYNGPNAPRLPYRTSHVPDSLSTFLERYDYVRDAHGVARIETTWHDADPPFLIEAREMTDADRYGRRVIDIADLSPNVRSFCESVLATRKWRSPPYVTDDVPDAFFETLQPAGNVREDPFVRVDGTVYYVGVTRTEYERVPVEVTAEPRSPGPAGRPRFAVRLAVTVSATTADVDTDEPVTLMGHAGLPGVLWVTHDGESHLLQSDDYAVDVERESTVGTAAVATVAVGMADREVRLFTAEERTESTSWSLDLDVERLREATVSETVPFRESRTATYEVPDTVPSGTYRVPGFFGARWVSRRTGYESGIHLNPFEIELTVERS